MKSKLVVLVLTLVGVILMSGCISQEEVVSDKDKAISACVDECRSRLDAGEDLSVGPCLLNPIPDLPDWVCDVAHSPRVPEVDNQPENQCSAFREGRASHFVEVDPGCELIRTW
jgi:hypothetical protein